VLPSKFGVKYTMRIVTRTSEKELAMRRAADLISREVVELTANLVRIGRGGGRPQDIERQLRELLRGVDAFRSAASHGPEPEVYADGLRHAWDRTDVRSGDDDVDEFHYAEKRVVRGALQVFASRLLGQNTQIQTGHNEMFDGIIEIEHLREKNRARMRSPLLPIDSARGRSKAVKPRSRKR